MSKGWIDVGHTRNRGKLFPNKIKAAGGGGEHPQTVPPMKSPVRVAADTPGLACRIDAASSIYPKHDKAAYQGVKKRRG